MATSSPLKKVTRFLIPTLGGILIGLIVARLVLLHHQKEKNTSSLPINYGVVQDFSLTDQDGNSFSSSSMKGSIWVADFIFTRCMGPCPVITSKMAQLQKEFPASTGVKFVSFSVDPDFDKPQVLKKYALSYNADPKRWFFLTGPEKRIYDLIRGSFHLAVEPGQENNQVIHSLHLVLIDKNGNIVGYFNTAEEESMPRINEKIKSLVSLPA